MFLYWLWSSLHIFCPPFSQSCPSICSAVIPYYTAMWCVYFLLFLVNSASWFFLLCLCNLYVLFQLLIHNSGFLLDHSVPSLSSVLPTPLKTFCCSHTPAFFVFSLFGLLGFHNSFSQKNKVCVPVSHICTLLYELLFSLSDTHSCSFLWQDCSSRSSSIHRLSPFLSKVLTCMFSLCLMQDHIKYIKNPHFLSSCLLSSYSFLLYRQFPLQFSQLNSIHPLLLSLTSISPESIVFLLHH